MTQLSINVNKFALLRNAREADQPNLIEICKKCIKFGAQGITLHPRPDERHAKFSDLKDVKDLISESDNIEFNIEGYPSEFFLKKVIEIKPDQVTLVPDPPEAITSSFGWNCKENENFLKKTVSELKKNNIRVSLFISPSIDTLENLNSINPDRVELYTFDYAHNFNLDKKIAIKPYQDVYEFIKKISSNIEFNAGHDLNLDNLDFLLKSIPNIKEVSIGHALVLDALDYGLEKTINKSNKITKSNK